jgi:ribonuclease MRP protein subunit RMP1
LREIEDLADRDRAFSNLVADNQYSALGLVLLGSLARVKSILGQLVEEEDDLAEVEVKVGKEGLTDFEGAEGPGDDFGEVVKREGILAGLEVNDAGEEGEDNRAEPKEARIKEKRPAAEETPQLTMANLSQLELEQPGKPGIDKKPGQDMVVHAQRPRKKRKKGKGDAFDDLFSSLI